MKPRYARFGIVFRYWKTERRTIRQGFAALVVASLGNLVAGITLGSITGTLEALPGLIVLIPAAVGMRGNIFGALGSRLGTSMHAGLYESSLRRGGVLFQNAYAAVVATFSTALFLGAAARLLTLAFGLDSISLAQFVAISLLGGLLSSLVVGVILVAVSVAAHRKAWDLDNVAAPIVTAVGDIVTIPALFVATFAVRVDWVTWVVAGTLGAAALVVTVHGWVTDLPTARRAIHESLPMLAGAGTVGVFSGLLLEARLEEFVLFPALLVLVPPFLADAGALGGILSARLSSKLHLGSLTPRGRPETVALLDTSLIFLFSVWLFALVGISADLVARMFGLASPGAATVLGISLAAGFLVTCVAVVVAYYTAVLSYRIGLDPDNHGIPIITSTMDLVGMICLVAAMAVFGVV